VVSDELVPVQFTEIFVPLSRATELVRAMDKYFNSKPNEPGDVYKRTGLFTFELYAAKRSSSWLSPAFSTGDDEWKDGAFRLNGYRLKTERLSPEEGPFGGIWKVIRESGIPFRLHWGKLQPSDGPPAEPLHDRWDRFLELRSERDPGNMFLTPYWCARLGLPPEGGQTCEAAQHLAPCQPVPSQ